MRSLAVLVPVLVLGGCLDDPQPRSGGGDGGACAGGFEGGVFNGTIVSASHLTLAAPPASGTFDSRVFSLGAPVALAQLVWHPLAPYGRPLPSGRAADPAFDQNGAALSDQLHNILLLHLDEQNGSLFTDSSGRNHDGSCTTGTRCPTSADGRFLRAAQFDATADQFIAVARDPELEPPQVTFETWAIVHGTGVSGDQRMMLIDKGRSPGASPTPYTSYSLEVATVSKVLHCYFGIGGGQFVDSLTAAPADQWFHAACSFDGRFLRVFFNGSLERTFDAGAGAAIDYAHEDPNQRSITLGRWGSTAAGAPLQRLAGKLDEVAIYDTALPEAVIRDHFLRGARRLQLQVRGCDDVSCGGATFAGPDGNATTFYEELCAPDASGAGTGVAVAVDRSLPLAGYSCATGARSGGTALAPHSFAQLHALLASDVAGAAPEVASIELCP